MKFFDVFEGTHLDQVSIICDLGNAIMLTLTVVLTEQLRSDWIDNAQKFWQVRPADLWEPRN